MAVPAHNDRRSSRRVDETWIALPPDPAVLKALGGGHTLESAIADIVDNSLDAQASRVRIRFITEGPALLAIQIRDDGTGMDQAGLERALRLGNRRDYGADDLGHFGIGLKAASMRHAEILRVYSSTVDGDQQLFSAVEMSSTGSEQEIGARVLRDSHAEGGYLYGYESEQVTSGTVVEWSNILVSSKAASVEVQQDWLEQTVDSVRSTLGLAFHRRIEAGTARIEIDVFDVIVESAGVPRSVDPVDPFHYLVSGRKGFPLELTGVTAMGIPVAATCHILPPRGQDKLPGRREDWQGIYVYRHDRLLTIRGGWQGLVPPNKDLRLARVEIELNDNLIDSIRPTPEKNGVAITPDYAQALEGARAADGITTFRNYIESAVDTWKRSNQRSREKPITRVRSGLPEDLIEHLGDNFGWRANQDPVAIEWRELDQDDLFKVDLPGRTLALNEAYSERIGGGEDTATSKLFSTLLYLLTESYFTRSSHHSSTQDYLEQVDTALLAAIATGDNTDEIHEDVKSPRSIPSHALAALLAASSIPTDVAEFESNGAIGVSNKARALSHAEMTPPPPRLSLDQVEDVGSSTQAEVSSGDPQQALPGGNMSTPPVSFDPKPAGYPAHFHGTMVSTPTVNDPLSQDDLDAFEAYVGGRSVAEIAGLLSRSDDDVARSLALAFFGADATNDESELASHHGLPYTPGVRERILTLFKGRDQSARSVLDIARSVGRTPLSISRFLLDSPTRPVSTEKRVRKNARRRLRIQPDATPPPSASFAEIGTAKLALELWGASQDEESWRILSSPFTHEGHTASPSDGWVPSNPLAAVKRLLGDLPGFETNVTVNGNSRGRPPEIQAVFKGQSGQVAVETITSWSPTSADLTTHRLKRVLSTDTYNSALLVVAPSIAQLVAATFNDRRVFVVTTNQLPELAVALYRLQSLRRGDGSVEAVAE